MSMGIVNDKEFEIESEKLIHPSNESHGIVTTIEKGRGKGNVEVPESLRKIIGETNELDGRKSALALGKSFGISPSSVSAYANGSTSTNSYDNPNKELKNHIDSAKERISKKARSTLFKALNGITSDKLNESRARDLSSVAKDMSAIIRNMEPDSNESKNSNSPTFVFYAPQPIKEDIFDVIYSKE